MRRLLLAGLLVLASPVGYAEALGAGHIATAHRIGVTSPHEVGPTKVAWYDASRPTAVAPAAPMLGVGKHDLVVEGLTINTALLPISLPIPTIREVAAYTALQFQVPDGATPGSLVLHLTGTTTAGVDGKLPSGVTPIACPATSPFKAGLQQPTSAAPKYDCSKRSTVGQLGAGGKTVVFPGISRLLTGNTLSFVILPGSLGFERLIFSPPGKDSLSLLEFTLPESSAPPVSPVPTPSSSVPAVAPSGGSIPSVPLPPAQTVAPAAPTPVVAPSSTTPAIATVAASKPDDKSQRAKAVALLVALVVAAFWLSRTDRRVQVAEWGVGRFRSSRTGPPPAI
jgi:hypothetical protein